MQDSYPCYNYVIVKLYKPNYEISSMEEIYCLPLTASTDKLHIGNLYTWILADSYKKASKSLDISVEVRESWNCFSKRLEDGISVQSGLSGDKLIKKCNEVVEANILQSRDIFNYFGISFSSPCIRDDSPEYMEIVIKDYLEKKKSGRANGSLLALVPPEKILENSSKICSYPKGALNSLRNAWGKTEIQSVELFRNGVYGVKVNDRDNEVFGQRYVQSLLPLFYRNYLDTPNIAIFGKDLLAKSVYFMLATSDFIPFNNLGLHGMVLRKSGKKISKYDAEVPLIKDIDSHPDNVRLSLLKQPFGSDFEFPNFDDEEKFRRKIDNCLNFLLTYSVFKEGNLNSGSNNFLNGFDRAIASKIRDSNFSGSYHSFKDFIYNTFSSQIIPSIKERGITSQDLNKVIFDFIKLSTIFTPITIKNRLSISKYNFSEQ